MGEVDLAAGRWALPAARSKNKRGYTIPVGPLAVAELEAAGATLHGFRGYSKMKRALDAASGVQDWRLHDLRRSCRTALSKLGVSREIGEACLNHVGGRAGLVGTYDRHDFANEIIAALGQWQEHVAGIVADPPTSSATVPAATTPVPAPSAILDDEIPF